MGAHSLKTSYIAKLFKPPSYDLIPFTLLRGILTSWHSIIEHM